MSTVKGLKEDLIQNDSGSKVKNWKDLFQSAKTNQIQYPNINNELLANYFNPNTTIISSDRNFANYRICKKCGKPILLNTIIDHLQNCSTGNAMTMAATSNVEYNGSNSKINNSKNDKTSNVNSNNSNNISTNNKNSSDDSGDEDDNNIIRLGNDDDDDDDDDDEDDDDDDDDDDDEDDDDDDEYDNETMRSSTSGKKRPPPTGTQTGGESASKKSKNESKKKRDRKVKQRNPTDKHLIDFDKQCGVDLPEGGYCARSLTCKSHSMGAKRSVDGRSRLFDELLAEYHRDHQTKIGTAAQKRAKQQELQKLQKQQLKEQKEQKKLLQQKQRQMQKLNKTKDKSSGGGRSKNSNNNKDSGIDDMYTNMPTLTPEEETTQVLNGVSRSFPLPLESTVLSSTRIRTKYFRMREMFASAFSVKQGYTSPGYGAIHSRVGCLDLDRTTDYKFRIRVPQPMNQINIPSNLTPQQLQKLQQHRMLQAQMLAKQQAQSQAQSQVQAHNQGQTQLGPNQLNSDTVVGNLTVKQGSPIIPQERGLTPQEIQLQQQKLRQQQLQQQKFEAAAFHLANASKLMQTTNNVGSPIVGNAGTADLNGTNQSSGQNSQAGSPGGGRVNIGVGSQVNGHGSRVN